MWCRRYPLSAFWPNVRKTPMRSARTSQERMKNPKSVAAKPVAKSTNGRPTDLLVHHPVVMRATSGGGGWTNGGSANSDDKERP